MIESTGKTDSQGGASAAWSLCLAAPLAATFLNLASATLRRAGGLATRDHLLLAIAGTLFTLLLLQAVLWLIARAVALVWDPGQAPRLLWAGTTVLAVALVGPVWQLVDDRLMAHGGAPAEKLLVAATTWAAALLLPLLAALWVSRKGLNLADRPLQALLLASPFLAVGVLLLAWAQVHWVSGIASLSSLLWLLGFAIAAVLCLFVAFSYVAQRRPLIPLAALTVLLLALPLASGGSQDISRRAPMDAPERILLLTVDTLRADALAPFSGPDSPIEPIEAPALEGLAADSVVFTGARSASPWTKPATASILTGVSPWVHGTGPLEAPLPERLRTLAEELRDAGYGTAGIGRNTFLRSAFNFDQGFDTFHFFPRGNGGILGAPLLRRLAPRRFATEPTTEELTDFALHWLEGHQDQAFFLWLHYFDPHGPFEPPQDLLPSGDPPGRIGTAFDDTAAIRNGELAPSLAEREWISRLYLAEMRHVDRQIGRVIDTLKRLDLYDGTLILFASDHGEEFWEHGGFEHGHTLYDEVIRVPLLVKVPGNAPNHRVEVPVSTESLTPTVLDLVGIDTPEERFTSPSLAPLLRSPGVAHEVPVPGGALHYFEDRESVLFDGLKYIRGLVGGEEELYDLNADPGETVSLVAERPEAVERARALLEEYKERSAELRRRLRLEEGAEAELEGDALDDLKSLGYVN